MTIYKFIDQIGFKKSYASKFLFVAFLGTHIPLIGLVLFVLFSAKENLNTSVILISILVLTVVAAVLTMLGLNKLLAPIKMATNAMNTYSLNNTVIKLPHEYKDEAGQLLNKIHASLTKIEELSQERQNFTSMISHDLRSPITSMVAAAELIKHETKNESIIAYSQMLNELGNNALNLIKDILQVIESKSFKIDESTKTSVDTKDFIKKQIDGFKPLLERKNISVEIIEKISNTSLFISPKFMASVIQNLLSNAIKFSKNNSKIIIEITTNHDYINLDFKDQGVGFKPEKATEIFNKFTTMRQKGTNKEDSSGIGLFLSQTIVKKHGGEIAAHSEGEGKGASFTLKLPLK